LIQQTEELVDATWYRALGVFPSPEINLQNTDYPPFSSAIENCCEKKAFFHLSLRQSFTFDNILGLERNQRRTKKDLNFAEIHK
jgi:hypothetical protein